jgi:hypothetical protein
MRTWDVIITIFNFTILAISAYIEWRNLKQEQSAIIKIMFGPGTGKTTLAIQLDHYKTAWVPEFARDYLQEKWDKVSLFVMLMICYHCLWPN